MDKIKKLWKEISIFGIVLIAFISLVAYQQIFFGQYTHVSNEQVVDMMSKKENFVLVVGNSEESNTLGYIDVMKTYVNENRDQKLYYYDVASQDATVVNELLATTLASSDTTYPQTFVITDGVVETSQAGVLTYYRLHELFQ